MKVISVTGTPCTGKSTLTKYLEKKLGFKRLDLHRYYKKISTGYNKSKQCYDIDLKKLEKLIKEKSKENLIVDSHISHLLKKVDLCIVLTCSNLKKLEKRLKERKYSQKKVRENLDAEIFQICLNESKEKKHKILVVDTGKRFSKLELVKKISKFL